MAELKTKATTQSVTEFINQIEDEVTRNDCFALSQLMEEVTNATAKMWGAAIVGVGDYVYRYDNGRTNDWFMMGFSPRKGKISLYILGCDLNENQEILSKLGKHKTGKGCIYIKTLTDINMPVLKELCETACQNLKQS